MPVEKFGTTIQCRVCGINMPCQGNHSRNDASLKWLVCFFFMRHVVAIRTMFPFVTWLGEQAGRMVVVSRKKALRSHGNIAVVCKSMNVVRTSMSIVRFRMTSCQTLELKELKLSRKSTIRVCARAAYL